MPTFSIKGRIIIDDYNPDGSHRAQEVISNLVTNLWKSEAASLLGAVAGSLPFTYLATGSGSTAETVGDTQLVAENTANGSARKAATVTKATTVFAGDTLTLTATRTLTGSLTVREIGAFNAASAGIMLGRKVFPADRSYSNGDSFNITYQFQIV